METINRAFEGADAFAKMLEKCTSNPKPNNRGDSRKELATIETPMAGNRAARRAAARKSKRK